jgi:hypothetical protein
MPRARRHQRSTPDAGLRIDAFDHESGWWRALLARIATIVTEKKLSVWLATPPTSARETINELDKLSREIIAAIRSKPKDNFRYPISRATQQICRTIEA